MKNTSHLVDSARNLSPLARKVSPFARNLSPFAFLKTAETRASTGFPGCYKFPYKGIYKGFYKKTCAHARRCGQTALLTAPQAGHVNDPGTPLAGLRPLGVQDGPCGPTVLPSARKKVRGMQALRFAAGDRGTGMPFATALAGLQAASGLKARGWVGWGQKTRCSPFWAVSAWVRGVAGGTPAVARRCRAWPQRLRWRWLAPRAQALARPCHSSRLVAAVAALVAASFFSFGSGRAAPRRRRGRRTRRWVPSLAGRG